MNYQDLFDNTGASNFIAHTQETRQKLRNINLGKKRSQEVTTRIVETRKANGYKHSAETCANISNGKLKLIQTPRGLFLGQKQAAENYGVTVLTIQNWLKSKSADFYRVA